MTKSTWQSQEPKDFSDKMDEADDQFEEEGIGNDEETDADEPSLSRDELLAQLAGAEAKVEEQVNSVLRAQADMENVRKRSQRDVANARKYALEKFIKELLPVIDSLERSLDVDAGGDEVALKIHEGVDLTLTMWLDVLKKFDVDVVNPKGEAFNAEHHEAVSMQPSDDAESGTVLQVLQKGYLLNGRLVRPAMVVVAA